MCGKGHLDTKYLGYPWSLKMIPLIIMPHLPGANELIDVRSKWRYAITSLGTDNRENANHEWQHVYYGTLYAA